LLAWLTSPVRPRTLAPFGGITRIRFKGSSNWTSQPLRLPRIVFSVRIRPDPTKSTNANIAARPPRRMRAKQTATTKLDGLSESNALGYGELKTRIYPAGVAPVSCFTCVWKMASQLPFSNFHTVPATYVPDMSFPSWVASILTMYVATITSFSSENML